jgi:hypothetical protein
MNLLDWLSQKRGRQAALAGELGIRPPTVSDWAAGDKRVALDRCPAIERATQGAVTVEVLRPDAAWSRIPDPSWPHPAGRPVIDVARPVVAVAQEG